MRPAEPARHILEYVLVRVLLAVALSLGYAGAVRFSRFLADLTFHFDRKHRLRALENLERAFPDLGPSERYRLARGTFRHFFENIIEGVYFGRLFSPGSVRRRLELRVHPEAMAAFERGRGVIIGTAHVGNWELAGVAVGLLGLSLTIVARPLDNPYLNRYVVAMRQVKRVRLIPKKGALKGLTRALREGENLALLVDQNTGRQGIFVEFFGRPASTTGVPAALALRQGAPILPAWQRRKKGGDCEHEVEIGPPLEVPLTGDRERDIWLLTQALTARVEEWIRREPEQWLWAHRRWKHQPKDGKAWRRSHLISDA